VADNRDVCSATNCSRHLDHGELAEWLKDLATIKPQNWSDLLFSKAAKIQKAVAERGGKEQSSEHVRSFVEAHCPWMEGTKHRQIFEAAVRRLLLDCQSIPSASTSSQGWIKGRPEKPGRYLAHIASSGTTVISDFSGGQRGWDYGYVTHWMPIPEAPK
jgi:hypothetical protein